MNPSQAFVPTSFAGCWRLRLPVHGDHRGRFVKSFHAPSWAGQGLGTRFDEDFFSISHRGVLRGFHVVTPPRAGAKLVYPIQGRVFDALLDLRPGEPSYGRVLSFELDADEGDALYVAPGVAHAFLSLSDVAVMGYKTEFAHDPSTDAGVRWDSVGLDWPVADPILSARDRELPGLDDFRNPFGTAG